MSTDLIQVKENKTVTTSLLVAEKFNREHRNVTRKIESIIDELETCSKLSALKYFEKSEYKDAHGQTRNMYFMNRDGFTLLAMSFTGVEALKWKIAYIEAFNEMQKKLSDPTLIDRRMEIARLIVSAPKERVEDIKELYPEYFTIRRGSLEYISDVNTSFMKWIEDYGITKDWIESFPTIDIYHNYIRYCVENKFPSMGKKVFYKTLEYNFNMTRRQRSGGSRFFMSA